ncbi:phage filamentation protein Fil family protein, partial [Enterobacter roggenkampii]|uniref:phage filamentation protein Fil family protein n=1 Tax=Enterobacter roggenkampii TaxID=1812935 RepID=UPI002FFC77C4
MLKNEPSLASLLVKQSPAMHYGHGWIAGDNGKRWRSCHDQSELLNGLKSKEGANKQVISSQADSLIKISRIWAD